MNAQKINMLTHCLSLHHVVRNAKSFYNCNFGPTYPRSRNLIHIGALYFINQNLYALIFERFIVADRSGPKACVAQKERNTYDQ